MKASLDRRMGCLALMLALAVMALPSTGCAYRQRDVFPEHVHTVAVPLLENNTFYRQLELHISEALTKEIETRTPYKVTRRSTADTVIEGTIVSVQQQQLSRLQESGLPQEIELRVTLNFTWKDLRSGEIIRERHGFTSVGRYIPARLVGDTLQVGEFEVAQRVAADIVSTMRADL